MPKTSPNTYYEPFLGGGAVFFALQEGLKTAVLADFNEDLTCAYTQVRDNPDAVIAGLKAIAANFNEAEFYKLRSASPTSDLDKAVRFIAYNRTCFNGLFRVNSAGGWNTPYGHLKNPTICNEPLLRSVSAALSNVSLLTGSYEHTSAAAGPEDLVYFDPPYLPTSVTASFSKYSAGDFTETDQRALAAHAGKLADAGAYVVLSNSDTPLSRSIFSAVLPLYQVDVKRSISANASSRGTVQEILATNVPLGAMKDSAAFQALATRI